MAWEHVIAAGLELSGPIAVVFIFWKGFRSVKPNSTPHNVLNHIF